MRLETVQNTGPAAQKFDIVFLGDGFLERAVPRRQGPLVLEQARMIERGVFGPSRFQSVREASAEGGSYDQ